MEIEPRSMSREMGELQIKEMWEAVNDSLHDLPEGEADKALESAHKAEAKLRKQLDMWDRLEKAAPELLEALKKIAAFRGGCSPWTSACVEIAREAIAKI